MRMVSTPPAVSEGERGEEESYDGAGAGVIHMYDGGGVSTIMSHPYPHHPPSMNMTEGLATISLAMVSRLRCSTLSPFWPGVPTRSNMMSVRSTSSIVSSTKERTWNEGTYSGSGELGSHAGQRRITPRTWRTFLALHAPRPHHTQRPPSSQPPPPAPPPPAASGTH